MHRIQFAFFLIVVLLLWACGGDTPEKKGMEEDVEPVEETDVSDEIPPSRAVEPEPADAPEPPVSPPPKAPEEVKVNPALLDPSLAKERAPDRYRVRFETTRGPFTVEVDRSWAPKGADRFYNLVKIGFFQDIAFFRVLDGFVAQFGISGDPEISEKWRGANIRDEAVKTSNRKGFITYAHGGKDTRTTQFFINLADNVNLDQMGFPPFGNVVEGMSVVESLYSDYGEGAPRGRGPDQGEIQSRGNKYLKSKFPKLDYIKKASLLQ